jgi:hypothetical protein
MGPSIAAVQRAAELFADPQVRTRVLTWHEQDVPFLEMVERLGRGGAGCGRAGRVEPPNLTVRRIGR